MRLKPALTIIEILAAIAILASLTTTVFISITGMRQKRALSVSAEMFAGMVRQAHIYAREQRDEREWGVKFVNAKAYSLVWADSGGEGVSTVSDLVAPATFDGIGFEIWFAQGTGSTKFPRTVKLETPNGKSIDINVSKEGGVVIADIQD